MLTRGGGAESLGLINTGVQVGFVREDFTGAMPWVLGVVVPGRVVGPCPQVVVKHGMSPHWRIRYAKFYIFAPRA